MPAPLGSPNTDLASSPIDTQTNPASFPLSSSPIDVRDRAEPQSPPASCPQTPRDHTPTPTASSVTVPPVSKIRNRRFWKIGGIPLGGMVLASVLLHGLVLWLPLPETAPPETAEANVEEDQGLDVMDVTVLPVPVQPPPASPEAADPAPDPPQSAEPPSRSSNPQPRAQSQATTPVSPSASSPSSPAPEAEEPDSPAADPAPPIPNPPNDPDPQRVGGLILPSGGVVVNDPADILSGAHLERYRRNGNRDPNIEGQLLVALGPDEDPRDVVEYSAEQFGVTDPIFQGRYGTQNDLPQSYRFEVTTTTGEEKLLTVDPVRDLNQVLITIWREFPL